MDGFTPHRALLSLKPGTPLSQLWLCESQGLCPENTLSCYKRFLQTACQGKSFIHLDRAENRYDVF
jgi:hypothetical protein